MLKNKVHFGSFSVVDGNIQDRDGALREISKYSGFNYEQYAVEHAPLDKNVLVRAGAGTGKTTTMISRIAYLAHQRAGSFNELLSSITMITFTNEAANNMEKKLKRQFMNSYLLTRDSKWLLLIERIDQMQISTIHSYAKSLMEQVGVEFGYGTGVRITSSGFERRKIITRQVEEYISNKRRIRFYFDSNGKVAFIFYAYARIEPHIFITSDGSLVWD